MPSSIESRITALEQRLAHVDPAERQVFVIRWVNGDRTVDPVMAYSDGDGRTLHREPAESPETFQTRAEGWIRNEHRRDNPHCICVLSPA